MKVMVVDDNAIVRLGLQSVLHRIETVDEVIEAEDAFSALAAHHAHSPAIPTVFARHSTPAHGATWSMDSWASMRWPAPLRPVAVADSFLEGKRRT